MGCDYFEKIYAKIKFKDNKTRIVEIETIRHYIFDDVMPNGKKIEDDKDIIQANIDVMKELYPNKIIYKNDDWSGLVEYINYIVYVIKEKNRSLNDVEYIEEIHEFMENY
jgi:hypothetical protein